MAPGVLTRRTEEEQVKSREAEPELFGVTSGSMPYCHVARQLLEAFGDAVQELMGLHEQQFQCVLAGDTTANRFDLLIHEANERKQQAKYTYIAHLELHGCSVINDAPDQRRTRETDRQHAEDPIRASNARAGG